MNKSELLSAVADASDVSKADVGRVMDGLIHVIGKTLKKNDKVSVVGFGTFAARKRAARQGRNPKTGAPLKIPASKTPTFKAGKAFKDAIK